MILNTQIMLLLMMSTYERIELQISCV